jgi:adenosylcobinamide-phosphate synthase
MIPLIAPLALIIERYAGYPPQLLKLIGHPVIWFGRLIDFLEIRLNKPDKPDRERQEAGIVALLTLLLATLVASVLVLQVTHSVPFGWVLEALLATPFLAQKELGRAVRAVAEALGMSLEDGREAVSHIVGRDPVQLDEAGVSRAAIETLAENASDGVIAPLFWLILFGLPGIALYKAINTADSMIGHMDARFKDFGWASARLDDLVNWIPARLTAMLFTIACFFVPKASPGAAWSTARRDAPKHNSPNAGWPEAAMAGALGFGLGGPRSYSGEFVDLPAMGDGRRELGPDDILKATRLYETMLWVAFALVAIQAFLRL